MAVSDQNFIRYQPRSFPRHRLCKRAASLASKILCLHFVTGGAMFVTAVTIHYLIEILHDSIRFCKVASK